MSGISRIIAKELSSALGITDNPKFNPMFKQTDEVISDVADPEDPTVARFYSPLDSAIENAPIGKEGTRGENVEAFVRKRAPKVSKAEMEFRGLGLEPSELYTPESAKESLKGLNIKAVKRGKGYKGEQRQRDILDTQSDYVELSLEAEENLGYPLSFHYGPSNIGHTRYSVRNPRGSSGEGEIKPYILIEELQSDAIQSLRKDFSEQVRLRQEGIQNTLDNNYDFARFKIENEGSGYPDEPIRKLQSYIQDVVIPTRLDTTISNDNKVEIFEKALKDLGIPNYTHSPTGPRGDVMSITQRILQPEFDDFDDDIEDLADILHEAVENYVAEVKAPITKDNLPVRRITDIVRMSLQAIISDAKARGIDEIVLPPVERLAKERATRDTPAPSTAKGSGFYNTYIEAYTKVLNQLKAELGTQIKVGKKPLTYKPKGEKSVVEQGVLLDISNLELDPTKTKLRFNKGGLVERPNK